MQRKYWFDYLFSVGGLFLFVLLVGKFYYLLELKLPLSYDESYYWDWSRKLDWGYFSKPPMVAWIIYLSTLFFGVKEFAVRMPALIMHIGSLVLFYILSFRYFGEIFARWHLFTLAFVPIFTVYSFIMTIDPPLLFFWTLSFYAFVEYLRKPTLLKALFSGLFLGCSLLTKQTSFLLLLIFFLYVYFFEKSLLSFKKTYVIFLLALLLYAPNIYWNFKHQFLLFKHTEEHFHRFSVNLNYYLSFWTGLFFLFGPIFMLLFFYIGFKLLPKIKFYFQNKVRETGSFEKKEQLRVFLLSYLLSFPPLLVFLILSFITKFNHNWLMPFFLFAYLWVLLFSFQSKRKRMLLNLNLFLTFLITLLVLILPGKPYLFGKSSVFLFKKFFGWPELAKKVEEYYEKEIPLVVSSRDLASSLAFYLSSHPEVYVVNDKPTPKNQYHLWRRCEDLLGKRVFFVTKGYEKPVFLEKEELLEKINLNFYGIEQKFSLWRGIYRE
ncbi:MAG: ArnT family glycosyltransferase [Caldimicrobium sp.]